MSPMRALVVDDELGIARLCQFFLESANYKVYACTDPRLAIDFIKRDTFDILITDIRMPYVDGFELLNLAQQFQPEMAVMFMTAFGTVEIAIHALRQGADGLILKPFMAGSDFIDAANQALRDKHRKRDSMRLQTLKPLFELSETFIVETNWDILSKLVYDAMNTLLNIKYIGAYKKAENSKGYSTILSTDEPLPWTTDDIESGFASGYIEKQQAVFINPGSTDDGDLQRLQESGKVGAIMIVPIVMKNAEYVVIAGREPEAVPLTPSDLEMFIILTRQSAVALDNARLYSDLLNYVKQIQETQRALIQAGKLAAAGKMLASVAHEINNPLQSVRNCLILASHRDLAEDQRISYLELAQSEIDRLSNTIQQMLDFYRAGKLIRQAICVSTLIQNVLKLLQSQLDMQNVHVEISCVDPEPKIQLMADQIQQVFFNLLLNAIDAVNGNMSEKRIWISIESFTDGLVIEIEDNGPGLSTEMKSHIFESFISTKEEGMGLGLSVSHQIVEAHEGKLELMPPHREQGACFRITLPINS
jgi:signal transduction histidine kinase/FixJ family two-component response regulator